MYYVRNRCAIKEKADLKYFEFGLITHKEPPYSRKKKNADNFFNVNEIWLAK